ncbi:ThiF family adenylyltransferase [Chryseobacterium sp.]|uniref:ThiF family adenylyltransferase n=1 Tax=Chryseobacterium sp. TaxID=1871047 RepID=UPI002FCB180D
MRFGFENITLVDGDIVEASNLNRQNYTEQNLLKSKAESLHDRLISINSKANIKYYAEYISQENLLEIIANHKIIINALDFTSEIPLLLDKVCQENNITILHPYNLGWGGLVTVIKPNGHRLESIADEKFNELKMVEYVSSYLRFWKTPKEWLEKVIEEYKNKKELLPPPQLSIASWIVAGMCTHIMYNILSEKTFKTFPEFYIQSII